MNSLNQLLPVRTLRWLRDDDDCAMVRIALPTVGIELTAVMTALPLGDQVLGSLMLHYDGDRCVLEYVTPMDSRPKSIGVDCAQSLQFLLASPLFALKMAGPFVARMRKHGLLTPHRDQP